MINETARTTATAVALTNQTSSERTGWTASVAEYSALQLMWLIYCCTWKSQKNWQLKVLTPLNGLVHRSVMSRKQLKHTTSWLVRCSYAEPYEDSWVRQSNICGDMAEPLCCFPVKTPALTVAPTSDNLASEKTLEKELQATEPTVSFQPEFQPKQPAEESIVSFQPAFPQEQLAIEPVISCCYMFERINKSNQINFIT